MHGHLNLKNVRNPLHGLTIFIFYVHRGSHPESLSLPSYYHHHHNYDDDHHHYNPPSLFPSSLTSSQNITCLTDQAFLMHSSAENVLTSIGLVLSIIALCIIINISVTFMCIIINTKQFSNVCLSLKLVLFLQWPSWLPRYKCHAMYTGTVATIDTIRLHRRVLLLLLLLCLLCLD